MKKTQIEIKKTQREIIEEELASEGYVANVWAIKKRILRLGAIICEIRRDTKTPIYGVYGSMITNYSKQMKKINQKNFHYVMSDRCVLNKDGSITLIFN